MGFTDFIAIYIILVLVFFAIPKTSVYLKKNISKVLNVSATILFGCLGVFYDSDKKIYSEYTWKEYYIVVLVFGILLLISGLIFDIFEGRVQKKIIAENEALKIVIRTLEGQIQKGNSKNLSLQGEYYKLCSDFIRSCFLTSFFEINDENSRISLYKNIEKRFVLLGRFSKNPKFNEKGRDSYPESEGFIALGWEKDSFEINNIPEFNSSKGRAYVNHIKSVCSIDHSIIYSLKMKSRSYLIIRINNEDSRKPLGIFVFERLVPDRINDTAIRESLSINEPAFASLLKGMKNLEK
ncbi:hypothetical protein [Sphingobacterium sp.]|uniref:hypothetical protein n=1 Tax=Sphingobacterium sp. TaxID=341027 RepID=UPI002FDE6276